jgi:hypothetical protein
VSFNTHVTVCVIDSSSSDYRVVVLGVVQKKLPTMPR